ncbi:MAG: NAD(P)H-dependent flavin oxidoreductase [Litorivicinus sp.]
MPQLPIIAAPMFLISGPELVVACCKAGIVGTFPALNQRTTQGLDEWLTQIKSQLPPDTRFGINLIVHPTNERLQADLEVIVAHQVPLVITSLGAVPDIVGAVQSYGGQVYHDVTTRRHAEKAAQAGVDGIIAVSAGAGGHAGQINPFALLAEVRDVFDGDLVLAGSINTGADVLAAQVLGARFAYMGTRLINTRESRADQAYQQMICDSYASDITYTDRVSGIAGNFLTPSLQAAGMRAGSVDLGAELTAPEGGASAWKSLWSAGHGVGGIHDVPSVAELVAQLSEQYDQARLRLA